MHQVLLIRITGEDRPGLTAAFTRTLAAHDVDVLDVNQAVSHRVLLLALMIRLMPGTNPSLVLGELLMLASEYDLRLDTRPVSPEAYEAWVGEQGKGRYILTILARKMTAARLAAVSKILAEQEMNIAVITRLTGRPRASGDRPTRACVECSVRGEPRDLDALHRQFMRASHEHDIDVAWQKDNAYRRNRRLVAFDMDSTLIQAEVIDELAREAGAGEQVAAITERAMAGELDFDQSLRERVAALAGLEETALARVAERLELTEGARTLIHYLKRFGYKTAIISGGFGYFGRFLQEKLGIDHVCANELELEGGRLTGRVSGPIVNGPRKAELLREIAETEGINIEQTIAVGDGANDVPMLNLAGFGIAFHAKPVVQASVDQQISTLGLDGILHLLGVRDRDLEETAGT